MPPSNTAKTANATMDTSTDIGVVRILSRDNDPDTANWRLTNDTISFLLFTWGSVYTAASQAVRLAAGDAALISQTQKFSGFSIGPGITLYNALERYADSLLLQDGLNTLPIVDTALNLNVGGLSITDNEKTIAQQQSSILLNDPYIAHKW